MPCHLHIFKLRNPISRFIFMCGKFLFMSCSSFVNVMIMHYNNINIRNHSDSLITYLMYMKVVGNIAPLLPDASFKLAYPYVHAMLLKCYASYLIILVCSLLARDCSVVIVVFPLIAFQCLLLECSRGYPRRRCERAIEFTFGIELLNR